MANWFTNFWDRLKSPWQDGYNFGDITSGVVQSIFGGVGDAVNTAFGTNVMDDLTGKSNTQAQNSAAAAMQEDAQAFNAEEAQKERDFNAQQAREAREWQEYMSNTAVQRQAKDYEAAGLNPWLAVGNGASSGSAVAASSGSASSSIGSAQASNVNMFASIGTAAAGIGLLLKYLKYIK